MILPHIQLDFLLISDYHKHVLTHLIFMIRDLLTWRFYKYFQKKEKEGGPAGIVHLKGKGKSVPLQAWSGPEGSRKLRFPDFITTAQDGGKVVSLTHRPPLPPGNTPGTHFC